MNRQNDTEAGQQIKAFTVNGKSAPFDFMQPATATGAYTIEIQMDEVKHAKKKWTLVNPRPGK